MVPPTIAEEQDWDEVVSSGDGSGPELLPTFDLFAAAESPVPNFPFYPNFEALDFDGPNIVDIPGLRQQMTSFMEQLSVVDIGGGAINIATYPDYPTMWNDTTTSIDAKTFVDNLEIISLTNISKNFMRCPICWLDFGTTIEDDPAYSCHLNPDISPIEATSLGLIQAVPFSAPDNDPVKTRCGHLFGKDCLEKVVREGERRCPLYRQDLIQ